MEVEEILDGFVSNMSRLHILQCDMRDLASSRLQRLYEYKEKTIENGHAASDESIDNNWLVARNPYSGKREKLVPSRRSVDELMLASHVHKNKQYMWLLAEAYEIFEDSLESLYAYVGYRNTDFWPLRDFGGIKLSELRSKEYGYFLEQAEKKRNTPASIMSVFRKAYTKLEQLEKDNELEVNLRLAVNLIESMRHIIVHLGGTVNDKDEFIKSVLEKSGLYNNGNPLEENLLLISSYFGKGEYKNTIVLTETALDTEYPLSMYVDELAETNSYLIGYIRILGDCIKGDESLSNSIVENA